MLFKIAECAVLTSDLTSLDSTTASLYKDSSEWSFEKRPGMLYVVVRAVSVGTNGNGDHFTEEELAKSYKTFVGKGNFVNHASNDVEKLRGRVVDAKWVDAAPADKYVKCLLEVDAEGFPELARMIRSGVVDSVSMGAVYNTGLPSYVTMADSTLKSYFEVEVGDALYTHDGTMGKVVAKGKEWHDNQPGYTIRAINAAPFTVSEDHPLLVLRRGDKYAGQEQFLEAKDIRAGDYLLSPVYSHIEPNADINFDAARILGWYLAEGSLCDKTGVRFDLSGDETWVVDLLKENALRLDKTATINVYNRKHAHAVAVTVYSSVIRHLVELHVHGTKASSKFLSEAIMAMEPEKQAVLIGSYIDGDGCMAKSYRKGKQLGYQSLHITTSSARLAQQIPTICERLEVLPSVQVVHRQPGKNSVVKSNFTEHTIHIGASHVNKLRHVSRKASSLEQVKNPVYRSFFYKGYVATPVAEIAKQNYTGWAYNIQVSSSEVDSFGSNHTYLMNGLVNHNCHVAYSECSICGNKAAKTTDYCDHVKFHKGGVYNGRQVFEKNCNVNFIELSWVTTGADPQAKVLEIIARQKGYDFQNLLMKAASSNTFDIDEYSPKVDMDGIALKAIQRARNERKVQ